MFASQSIGCMLASAYGDSLGASVEFSSLATLRAQYGPRGITIPQPAFGFYHPVITDDTQMAMGTARGLIRGFTTRERANDTRVLASVWNEYLAWLATQSDPRACRSPGSTCLSALCSDVPGTRSHPLNDSAGCGGTMRVHPVGLACARNPERAFTLGMQTAALTHGNPNGYVPAGALAMLIAHLVAGQRFVDALRLVWDRVSQLSENERRGTHDAIRIAWETPTSGDAGIVIDTIVGQTGSHGGGWLGHDCFAIAIYAIRCAPSDPLEAIRIAVNHSGDSDSTGAVAGAIAGTMHGPDPIIHALAEHRIALEHHELLADLGQRLAAIAEEDASHG